MSTGEKGSISHWIVGLKAGDRAAAQPLWDRYFELMVRLARARLRAAQRGRVDEDEEDAALSAFDSFCAGVKDGRFPRLSDRHDLWRLLVTITVRKAFDQIQRRQRLKRGGERVVDEAALGRDGDDGGLGLDRFAGGEPTPDLALMLAEELRSRLDRLDDDGLRRIALWRMEGYTNEEIARNLGCVTRSVERKLNVIRQAWLEEGR